MNTYFYLKKTVIVKLIILLFIFLSLFKISCSKLENYVVPPPFFEKKDSTLKREDKGVIIFVHGIFSDPITAWTNDTAHTSFPKLVSKDPAFANYDVYVASYPTPKFEAAMNIYETGSHLYMNIYNDSLSQYKDIIFVCHSMGGLVTRACLNRHGHEDNFASKVKMIFYFATPNEGSEIANIGTLFSDNKALENMTTKMGNEILGIIDVDWSVKQSLNKIPAYSAYEDRDTDGVRIVSMNSAKSLGKNGIYPIFANHLAIVKPKDSNDDPMIYLRRAYKVTLGYSMPSQSSFYLSNDLFFRGIEESINSKKSNPNFESVLKKELLKPFYSTFLNNEFTANTDWSEILYNLIITNKLLTKYKYRFLVNSYLTTDFTDLDSDLTNLANNC